MAEEITVSTRIEAPASQVYEMLADMTRIGEWSPEARGITWLGGATGTKVGARFKGHNRHGISRWSTTCEITAADPGKEIAWDVTFWGMPVARWTYRIEADGADACTVTEHWQDKRAAPMRIIGLATLAGNRAEHNRKGMEETLRRLKAAAERSPQSPSR